MDIEHLRVLAKAATPGPWHAGHLADDGHDCCCASIMSESHAGAIAEVYINNGKAIRDGGNDCPSLEDAKANLRYIAACDPQTILALIERVEQLERFTQLIADERDDCVSGGIRAKAAALSAARKGE